MICLVFCHVGNDIRGDADDRLTALSRLMTIIKKSVTDEVWEKHFKTVLLLLLETLRDSNVSLAATESCSSFSSKLHTITSFAFF